MAFNERRVQSELRAGFDIRTTRVFSLTARFSVIAVLCYTATTIIAPFWDLNDKVRVNSAAEVSMIEKNDFDDIQAIILSPDVDRRAAVLIPSEDRRSFQIFIDNLPVQSPERAVLWVAPRAGTTIPIGVFKNGDTLELPEDVNFVVSRYYISIEQDENFAEAGMRGRIVLQGQM